MQTMIVVAASCGAVVITIGLFVSGLVYARPAVDRIVEALSGELQRARIDADYYRTAAQSCAATVAHREAQLRVAESLLSGRNDDCEET
jgi:hypothetical protein